MDVYLIIKFLASGIFCKSTSTFAMARTSAEALIVAKKSVIVALPATAVNAPNDPTTKYWNVREELCADDLM